MVFFCLNRRIHQGQTSSVTAAEEEGWTPAVGGGVAGFPRTRGRRRWDGEEEGKEAIWIGVLVLGSFPLPSRSTPLPRCSHTLTYPSPSSNPSKPNELLKSPPIRHRRRALELSVTAGASPTQLLRPPRASPPSPPSFLPRRVTADSTPACISDIGS